MTRLSVGQVVSKNLRKYNRESSVVFFKTKEQFGGLSNMAGGYPLQVNGIDIRSSEALYQACRFPHRSDLQFLVIEQKSPMTAEDEGPNRTETLHGATGIKFGSM